jgi:hypothetical protein
MQAMSQQQQQQQQPVWQICIGTLSQNLQEAAELADVLQECAGNIQVCARVCVGGFGVIGAAAAAHPRPHATRHHPCALPPTQVTGWSRSITARTSTNSGNPTKLSVQERLHRAVPLAAIGAHRARVLELEPRVCSAQPLLTACC